MRARYIPQFARGGFPELYCVLDTRERVIVSDPKPYHEANAEAFTLNNPADPAAFENMAVWLNGMNLPIRP